MEIVNKISNSLNEIKELMNSVVEEIKDGIKENLGLLSSVKTNLATYHNGLEEIGIIAEDLSIEMELMAETINNDVEELENVLAVIDPENFGDEEDLEEEDCVVVEDLESGEETEYPIN